MVKKSRLKLSGRLLKKRARKLSLNQKKHCRFCASVEQANGLDYKNANLLRGFLTERGKILPARISGTCAFHQRQLAHMIKKSRMMSLVAYYAPNY